MRDLHLNSEFVQPPVNCPLLIRVGEQLVKAWRENWESSKDAEMEFVVEGGEKVRGKFPWTYP